MSDTSVCQLCGVDDYAHVEGCRNDPNGVWAKNQQLRDLLAVAKTIITKHHSGSEAEIEYWGRLCPVCFSYLSILDAIYAETQEQPK